MSQKKNKPSNQKESQQAILAAFRKNRAHKQSFSQMKPTNIKPVMPKFGRRGDR